MFLRTGYGVVRSLPHISKFSKHFLLRKLIEMARVEAVLKKSSEIKVSIQEAKKEAAELEKLVETYIGSVLKKENEELRKVVQQMKEQLIKLEILNGIEQVPVPSGTGGVSCSGDSSIKDQVKQQISSTPIEPTSRSKDVKENKKDSNKKEKKGSKKEEPASKEGESGEAPVDVRRLDLRVGKIVEVKRHPDADSLYVEQVDVGQEKPLTVVSGLVKHVPIEEMEGRLVVLLCNLKPAKMRGVTSEAMVMCASTQEKVEVLLPPPGSCPGDLVEVEGFPRAPDPVLNPKKKIFENVAPDLKTDDNRNATYKGAVWTVPGKGSVTTLSLTNVNIK